MVVRIAGERMYLWRAVDHKSEVLDILVQRRCDTRAALRLMRKLLKKQGFAPKLLVTDKLRSYAAAFRQLGLCCPHEQGLRRNNRAENSHQLSKARDAAGILAADLGVNGYSIGDGLGENDRLATGYLPRLEFEAAVDEFFARPQTSVRGWEPAAEAQARIVRAVEQILSQTSAEGDLAIVGHGGTGTLLYCHLAGLPIDRRYDQPATNGGNWFIFDRATRKLLFDGWRSIDAPA